jgi:hypothetical protein
VTPLKLKVMTKDTPCDARIIMTFNNHYNFFFFITKRAKSPEKKEKTTTPARYEGKQIPSHLHPTDAYKTADNPRRNKLHLSQRNYA